MNLYAFILSATAFTIQQFADYYQQEDLCQTLPELKKDYGIPRVRNWDYIVVGGGSAGCILAEQLSQAGSVLLLEKGGEPVPDIYNNKEMNLIYTHPAINDVYTSWPQTNAFAANNGTDIMTVGRMLGGSGSHNSMIYNRGAPQDYDNWANLMDPSLRYENMLQYFKAVENYKAELVEGHKEEEYYGHHGPMWITSDIGRDFHLWAGAAKELGYKVKDPNAHQSPSFTPPNFNYRNGLRHNSYTAFVQERARNRPSLTIQRYSVVQNVLIDEHKMVYGVAYLRHGIPQVAYARKEVILTAGAIGTPALLIKSGIGPRKLLEEAGIPVVNDVPGVGATYQDHPLFSLNFQVTNATSSNQWFHSIEEQYGIVEALEQFHRNDEDRKGLFARISI